MKNTQKYIIAAFALLLFWNCSEELVLNEAEQMTEENQEWVVSIDATKGGEDTRALGLNGNVLNATWTAGDVVSVTKNGTSAGTLTAKTSGTQTVLQGTLTGPFTTSDKLTLSYLSPDYTGQDGTLAYIASHCDYAVAEVAITSTSGGVLVTSPATFKNQQAITEFTFTDGTQTIHPTELRISTVGKKLVKTYNGTTPEYGYVYLTLADPDASSFLVALKNESEGKDEFRFVAKVGSDYYTGTKKADLVAGKYFKTTVSLSKFEMKYVYMGNAGYWATCNLGAFFEDEYGDYYAWGEVETKSTYTWGNYKWAKGSETTLTKYCSDSTYGYEGFTDDKTVLDLEDDAAHVKLGGNWRMPTVSQEQWLWNQYSTKPYTWTEETVNGVFGYRVTYNNNSIFLPAGGYYANSVTNSESWGGFWSSALWTSNPSNCRFGHFKKDQGLQFYYGTRKNGRTIRPVYDPNLSVPVTGVTLDKTTMTLSGVNSTGILTATITPSDASNTNVTWSSSNTSVATVSNGTVTAKGAGTATITVITADGGKTDTCEVTVIVAPTAISLSSTSLSVKRGNTAQITATLTPAAAANYPVTWSSSNSTNVSVDQNGLVTGLKTNTSAIITATAGDVSATCTVRVAAPDLISFSLSPSSLTIFPGDEVTVTAILNPSDAAITSNYWYIDADRIAGLGNGSNTYRVVHAMEEGSAVLKVVLNGKEKNLPISVISPAPSSAIDLGLSVKWGDRNLFATTPTNPGRYFKWSEAVHYNGTTTDVAQYLTDYRMPTKTEMQELIDNCTVTTVTQDNVKGLKFTSKKNGNSIFLPDVGGYDGDTFYSPEMMSCCYWTSTGPTNASGGYRLQWYVSSRNYSITAPGVDTYKYVIRPVKD